MADRQLKIVVRTEIKKGFADLNKQLQQLNASMQKLGALSASIDKLSKSFDGVARGAKSAARATNDLKKAQSEGASLVAKYASAQEKLSSSAEKLAAAEKAGAVNRNASVRTQIRMLDEYIKKTKDLSVLERRRDSKGRFGYGGFSGDAVKSVRARIQAENAAIQREVSKAAAQSYRKGSGRSTMDIVNGSTGVSRDSTSNFERLRQQYQNQERRERERAQRLSDKEQASYERSLAREARRRATGGSGGGGSNAPSGGGRGFGRLPGNKDVGVANQLLSQYTKLGHILFQLQYSTLTIIGATGVGAIIKQVDAFIQLKNEIARTSDNIDDLGGNLKEVFKISKATFTDVNATGKLFATFNKYSGALGLDGKGVSNLTQNVSAAFAASGGTKESRDAAQYQFLQGFQSGKFGGDELRSVLEAAPYVGDLLSRGLAKQRGMPEGSRIDLRAQKGKIGPQEIAKVFEDPQFAKEINKALADRARTFGDVMSLTQTRLTELAGQFEESTGLFGGIARTISNFLIDDTKMKGFTDALQAATIALVTYGAAVALKSGIGAAGGVISSVGKAGGALGAGLNVARKSMMGATMAMAIDPGGTALNALKGIVPWILNMGKALLSVGGVFTALAAFAAILAARFNYLLGRFGDGISIFDILAGLWDKMGRFMGDLMLKMGPVGQFFQGLINWIDRLLMRGVNAAKNDDDIRRASFRSDNVQMIGGQWNDKGKAADRYTLKGKGTDGKEYEGVAIKDSDGNLNRDANGRYRIRTADGKIQFIGKDNGLPSGMKAGFPPATPAKTPKEKRDPVKELMRDLALQVAEGRAQSLVPSQMQDVAGIGSGNIKKMADAMNLDGFDDATGLFADDAKLLDMIKNKNKDAYNTLVKANADLEKIKLGDALKQFVTTLNSQVNDIYNELLQKGMTGSQQKRYGAKASLAESIMNNPALSNMSDSQKENARSMIAMGQVDKLLASMSNLNPSNGIVAGKEEDISAAVGRVNEALDRLEEWSNNGMNGVKLALKEYADRVSDAASSWGNVVTTALQGLEDTLVDFITNPDFKAGESFKALGLDITKAIARAFVQQKVMQPLMKVLGLGELGSSAMKPMFVKVVDGAKGVVDKLTGGSEDGGFLGKLSSMFGIGKKGSNVADGTDPLGDLITKISGGGAPGGGGILSSIMGMFKGAGGGIMSLVKNLFGGMGGGGGILSSILPILTSFFHEGGVAGTNSGMSRPVHPAVFRNATRYHTGGIAGMPALGANEVPAILQRGERILSHSQQAAIAQSGGGTGNIQFSPSLQINYTASSSGGDSEADAQNMGKMLNRQLESKFNELMLKAKRDGGILSGR